MGFGTQVEDSSEDYQNESNWAAGLSMIQSHMMVSSLGLYYNCSLGTTSDPLKAKACLGLLGGQRLEIKSKPIGTVAVSSGTLFRAQRALHRA